MKYKQNKVKSETINAEKLDGQISTNLKKWLSPAELEAEYGFSRNNQSKMRMQSNNSNIPFSKVGRYIRYNRDAINIWLQNHQVQGEIR